MQFVDILNDFYDRSGHAQSSSVDAAVARRAKRFINTWNRRVLSSNGMAALRRVIITKASVASQPTYGVAIGKIKYLTETTTQRKLDEKPIGWYRERFPDPSQFTGTPLWWVPLGTAPIHTRPSNASELFIKSTSASDTNTASIEVVRSDGYSRLLAVSMTGVTAVSLGTAITDIVDVVDLYLSAAAVGTVTLHEDSGAGTELSRIPIGATRSRFLRFALAPTPSQVITYTIDGESDVNDLVNDADEPPQNADFHDILVLGAVYEEWRMRGRAGEASMLLNGGNPNRPTPDSIEGRIRRLRSSLIEWEFGDTYGDERRRTFDETIQLPIA